MQTAPAAADLGSVEALDEQITSFAGLATGCARRRGEVRTEGRLHRPAPAREVVRALSVARSLEGGSLPTAGKCRKQFATIPMASLSRLEMHLSIPPSRDHS